MEENQTGGSSTHIVFDGKKIIVSSDVVPVFTFLMEIEKEVKSLLGFDNQIEGIRADILELMDFIVFLGTKLKENGIDFEYKLKQDPKLLNEKLEFHLPIRSQMIVMFASLEVLYFLHIAYEKEIDDDEQLKNVAMKDQKFLKKFINSYVLNNKNEYYNEHQARLIKLDSKKIRDLRNSLTHFFSLSPGGLGIVPDVLFERARKLENILNQNKHGNIVFISPEDLHELIRNAYILRIQEWGKDFLDNPINFKGRMKHVIALIEEHGAFIVSDNMLKI